MRPTVLGLLAATALHKLAFFAWQGAVGRAGGAEALGAVATISTFAGTAFALSHLGLPDRATFLAARGGQEAARQEDLDGRAAHGLFLALALVSGALVLVASQRLGGSEHRSLAWAVAMGSLLQHFAAITLGTLRGAGRPLPETLALLGSGAVLLGVLILPGHEQLLGAAFTLQGAVFVVLLCWGAASSPALRPGRPSIATARARLGEGLPYYLLGGVMLTFGGATILLVRLFADNAAVGIVHAATVVVRTGLLAPWLVAVFALKRSAASGQPQALGPPLAAALLMAGGAALLTVLGEPLIEQAFGLGTGSMRATTWFAVLLAPPAYAATMLLPIATERDPMAATLVSLAAGCALALLAWPAWHFGGANGIIIAHAITYLGLALGLARIPPRMAA